MTAQRHRLVREGSALIRYVTGRPATSGPIRRYVRIVSRTADPQQTVAPEITITFPCLLRLLEPMGSDLPADQKEFVRRLNLAVSLSEASPGGAEVFWPGPHSQGRLTALLRLTGLMLLEGLFLPFRWLLTRVAS